MGTPQYQLSPRFYPPHIQPQSKENLPQRNKKRNTIRKSCIRYQCNSFSEVIFIKQLSTDTVFGIVGGDLRQAALAKSLDRDGYPVKAFLLENLLPPCLVCRDIGALQSCDIVIFPLPISKDGNGEQINAPMSSSALCLSECLKYCRSDAFLFGGKISPTEEQLAHLFGHHLIDYLKQEEMAVLNAVPTAEGAVGIALSERASTLWESHCLITGFGRCAKTLALLLKGFGAKITIAARNPGELAFARTLGFSTVALDRISDILPCQDIIFNTVPSLIFGEELLTKISDEALIIDLASCPGGIDFQAASRLGKKSIWALSLPGKVAPVTAGNIIRDTVLSAVSSILSSKS